MSCTDFNATAAPPLPLSLRCVFAAWAPSTRASHLHPERCRWPPHYQNPFIPQWVSPDNQMTITLRPRTPPLTWLPLTQTQAQRDREKERSQSLPSISAIFISYHSCLARLGKITFSLYLSFSLSLSISPLHDSVKSVQVVGWRPLRRANSSNCPSLPPSSVSAVNCCQTVTAVSVCVCVCM